MKGLLVSYMICDWWSVEFKCALWLGIENKELCICWLTVAKRSCLLLLQNSAKLYSAA